MPLAPQDDFSDNENDVVEEPGLEEDVESAEEDLDDDGAVSDDEESEDKMSGAESDDDME